MDEHQITRFPPILQLVVLGLLGGYVLLSLLGRISARFRWLWRDPDDAPTFEHIVEYTVVPALVLAFAATAVVLNWDGRVPLSGGWSARDLILGPAAALLGVLAVVIATVVGRRTDTSEATSARAWIPLVLVLAGIALLVYGVLTLGRVKGVARGDPSQAGSVGLQHLQEGPLSFGRAGLVVHR